MKTILTVVGGIAGGVLGFFATGWLAGQGLYSVLLPGAFLGLGTLLGKGSRGIAIPVLMGLLGVSAVYLAEWHYFPFISDHSLGYFVGHLSSLKPITHVMAALGGLISFWVPFRSRAGASGRGDS